MSTAHADHDVERHYDAQANQSTSRAEAMQRRNAGALIKYKKHANAVKRRMIEQYASGAPLLVDLGCGRGGDINKWREARIRNVVALDLSAQQLDEARRRENQDPSRRHTDIAWLHKSMMAPDLLETLRPKLPAPAADAVAAQFAIQYAFGIESTASRVLGVASALLRDGGVFFGVAPDATAILRLIESNSAAPAAAMETHLQPPAYPFSLLLRLLANGSRDEFGAPLLFSLEDTVTAGSEDAGCTEYLCFRETLVRLAAAHGLHPIEIESLADARGGGKGNGAGGKGGSALGPGERLVADLYFTFAFVKSPGAAGPPSHGRATAATSDEANAGRRHSERRDEDRYRGDAPFARGRPRQGSSDQDHARDAPRNGERSPRRDHSPGRERREREYRVREYSPRRCDSPRYRDSPRRRGYSPRRAWSPPRRRDSYRERSPRRERSPPRRERSPRRERERSPRRERSPARSRRA